MQNKSLERYSLIPVKTYYLKMTSPPARKLFLPDSFHWEKITQPDTNLYLQIYTLIGSPWGWAGRKIIPTPQLDKILSDPKNILYFLYFKDQPAGILEFVLDHQEAEILYFGLAPHFLNKGWGKAFLSEAINLAFQHHPNSLKLHTCEYDHPNALSAYQKAGFILYNEQIDYEYYDNNFLSRK